MPRRRLSVFAPLVLTLGACRTAVVPFGSFDSERSAADSALDSGSDSGSGLDSGVDSGTDSGAIDEPCGTVETLDGADYTKVCGGTFEMGCTAGQSDCQGDETQHTVTLTHDYWTATHEVTQRQFEEQMGYNPSGFVGCGSSESDCPVDSVTWHEGAAYATARSEGAGLAACYACSGSGDEVECSVLGDPYRCAGYRIPTEAEWEGAARCGEDHRYAQSEAHQTIDWVAWYLDNSGETSHTVGGKTANTCGLYDMSGNVWEWALDAWDRDDYPGDETDPFENDGIYRVFRGGGWDSPPEYTRVVDRAGLAAIGWDDNLGFRLVRSAGVHSD